MGCDRRPRRWRHALRDRKLGSAAWYHVRRPPPSRAADRNRSGRMHSRSRPARDRQPLPNRSQDLAATLVAAVAVLDFFSSDEVVMSKFVCGGAIALLFVSAIAYASVDAVVTGVVEDSLQH